ncbi:sirohydrochlorin cobaltochelatase [Lentilactobacillus rapi]|uniref:sirohydrochlorin cobaltochelatase n=1 Tax=Lentilactobacillus rapi TaxID=481723 RepID=UPI000B2F3E6C|nr:sirohydrochlorin cobaltochelatase [Lentilactobacillus rapi]
MAAGADLRKLADWQFIAKNHVVARHLKSSGIVVDRVADLASTSGQPTYVIGEQRELADMNPQAAVHLLATYRRLPAEQDLDFADYQTIVFPSSASVAELVSSLSQDQLEALRVLKCIAMGPKVAEKCHQVGLNNVVTVEPSYQAVLTVLKEAKKTLTKSAILIVSFGTTYPDTRKKSIGSVEQAFQRTFPDSKVFRAFTSNVVIKRIQKNEQIKIDTPTEALEKIRQVGFEQVYVQSLHLIPGIEYDLVKEVVAKFQPAFQKKLFLARHY